MKFFPGGHSRLWGFLLFRLIFSPYPCNYTSFTFILAYFLLFIFIYFYSFLFQPFFFSLPSFPCLNLILCFCNGSHSFRFLWTSFPLFPCYYCTLYRYFGLFKRALSFSRFLN